MNVVLIGFGHWGRVLYPKIRSVFRNEIHIAVPRPERIPGAYIPPGAKLLKADPDEFPPDARAWIIATPRDTHIDWVMKGLEKDVFIFCEKPLSSSPAKAELALAMIKKQHSVFQMNFVDTWNPGFKKVLRLIPDLDRPLDIKMRHCGMYPMRSAEDILWELGPHAIACARKLVHGIRITDVRFDQRASCVDLSGMTGRGALDIHLGANEPKCREHVLTHGDRRVRYDGNGGCVAETWLESGFKRGRIARFEYPEDALLNAIRAFYESCLNPDEARDSGKAFQEAVAVDSMLREAQQRLAR